MFLFQLRCILERWKGTYDEVGHIMNRGNLERTLYHPRVHHIIRLVRRPHTAISVFYLVFASMRFVMGNKLRTSVDLASHCRKRSHRSRHGLLQKSIAKIYG